MRTELLSPENRAGLERAREQLQTAFEEARALDQSGLAYLISMALDEVYMLLGEQRPPPPKPSVPLSPQFPLRRP